MSLIGWLSAVNALIGCKQIPTLELCLQPISALTALSQPIRDVVDWFVAAVNGVAQLVYLLINKPLYHGEDLRIFDHTVETLLARYSCSNGKIKILKYYRTCWICGLVQVSSF